MNENLNHSTEVLVESSNGCGEVTETLTITNKIKSFVKKVWHKVFMDKYIQYHNSKIIYL